MGSTNLALPEKETDFYHVIQPIMDLSDAKVYGYEVLLRSEQFPNPEFLFNYAKEQDQLFDLDMKSIHKALTTFNKEAAHLEGLHLFINIFPSTLISPDFHYQLQQLKSEVNISPDSIVFEINEAEKMPDLAVLNRAIMELKRQGFVIAIDDIGKGESSLKTVLELEPNIAKIDRYFTRDLATSPKKQKFIKLMLQLFGGEITIVLEGFECKEDLLTAKAMGVPFGQGFYLGKPKPIRSYM
ncbi:EAL domain-containing protein [Virgibacillus sp. FSP13]